MTPKKLKLLLLIVVFGNVAVWFFVHQHWNDRLEFGPKPRMRADEAAINQALASYKQTNGQLPSTSEGLDALVHKPSNAGASWYPLLEFIPKDPWGHLYHYRLAPDKPRGYDVFSLGPDGVGNTKDDIHLK